MRKTTLFMSFLTICVSVLLYHSSYQVEQLEEELVRVHRDIQTEEEALRVLDAEWSYLTRPERLVKLSENHLALSPLQTEQMAGYELTVPATTTRAARHYVSGGEAVFINAAFGYDNE